MIQWVFMLSCAFQQQYRVCMMPCAVVWCDSCYCVCTYMQDAALWIFEPFPRILGATVPDVSMHIHVSGPGYDAHGCHEGNLMPHCLEN